jgi:hypothetical protein
MNFFEKLNIFSRYLEDWFYINNNTIKQVPAYGGYHKSDFDLLTSQEVLQGLPADTYLTAKFHACPNQEDNTFVLELLQNEYSTIKSDNVIRNENLVKFASTLGTVKSLLSGDQISVDIEDMEDFIIRDDFAVNGKVHTIYSKLYKITLN